MWHCRLMEEKWDICSWTYPMHSLLWKKYVNLVAIVNILWILYLYKRHISWYFPGCQILLWGHLVDEEGADKTQHQEDQWEEECCRWCSCRDTEWYSYIGILQTSAIIDHYHDLPTWIGCEKKQSFWKTKGTTLQSVVKSDVFVFSFILMSRATKWYCHSSWGIEKNIYLLYVLT